MKRTERAAVAAFNRRHWARKYGSTSRRHWLASQAAIAEAWRISQLSPEEREAAIVKVVGPSQLNLPFDEKDKS